jgi:hypothetical protein
VIVTLVDSPLARTTQETPTDCWNDSCAVAERDYAVSGGATGATSNPAIVGEVMKKEKDHWAPGARELAAENLTCRRLRSHGRSSRRLGPRRSRAGRAGVTPTGGMHP